ncbi:hypothetical protein STRTUCAR8_00930, partial [Streptomyces turgidiscabies Car8]
MTVAIAPSETSESPEPSETPEMPSVAEEFAGSEWSEPSAEPGDADGATDEASVDPADVSPLVARDAQEFGAYARTGGWAFGLKVARSVRPGGQPPVRRRRSPPRSSPLSPTARPSGSCA